MTGDEGQKVAWVTGAGRGIGRALATTLAGRGWTVAVSARTAGDLENLAHEAAGERVHPFVLDVTDGAAVTRVVDAIEDGLGPIDLAVLNAGTYCPTPVSAFTADAVRDLFDVNLMGTVHCLEALLPRMTNRRAGHLAVMASLAGYRGLPYAAAYGASKAALIAMCESLRSELALRDVRLQVINPGFVETPLTDRNDFPMPFLISAETAAAAIVRGLEGSAFEIAFPWRFAVLMKLLRVLPDPLFFQLTGRMVRS